MPNLQTIEMLAGVDAKNAPVIEKIPVHINDQHECTLAQSPAFVKGIARGDLIKFNPHTQQFEVLTRSGNLCVRVFSRGNIHELADKLTGEIEKLGGELDLATPRMLVYSVHVSCGFSALEALLNEQVDGTDSAWLYGNVYDPNDGVTPLNWWLPLLKPE